MLGGMTTHHTTYHARTPYDDVVAAERRWAHLSPRDLELAARRDPLRFFADHLAFGDRHAGTVGIFCDLGPSLDPALVVVPDAPADPSFEECVLLVRRFCEEMQAFREYLDDTDFRIGLVIHRTGSTAVNDLDRRWLLALTTLAPTYGYDIVGVMARTEAGALVTASAEE